MAFVLGTVTFSVSVRLPSLTVTLTASDSLTVMVTEAEVAGFPVEQVVLEVSLQVTTSPFSGM